MKIDENLSNIFNIESNVSSNIEEISDETDIKDEIDEDILEDDDTPDFDKDFKFARNCIVKVMKYNADVIQNMTNIADATEHPRAYEVAGQLMKSQSDLAKELLELYKKKKHITEVKQPKKEETIVPLIENQQNNILFTGSTADLLKVLNNGKENR